jgi:hypothetical protein
VIRHERRVLGALIHRDIKLSRIGRVGHRIRGDRRTRTRGVSTAAFLAQAHRWFARGIHGAR